MALPDDDATEPPPMPSPEKIATAQQQWQDDYVAQLDRELAEQNVDVAWSQRASAQLEANFDALAPHSSVEVSGCGSTLCKVEVSHVDDLGHEELLVAAQTDFPWSGPGFLAPTPPEQGHKSVVYVARAGAKLPEAAMEVSDYW